MKLSTKNDKKKGIFIIWSIFATVVKIIVE